MRDVGELGESTLASWAAHAGLIAQRVYNDKTAWDYLLEFPMQQLPGQSLDKICAPLSCIVQVKATDKLKPSFSVKLSNWLRMVLNPQPAFFLVLKFSGQQTCTGAYLIHCGHKHISDVLKRCRILGCKETLSSLARRSKVLQISEDDSLDKLDGIELAKKIREVVGPSLDEYQKQKVRFRDTIGYEELDREIKFSIESGENLTPTEELLDLFLGLRESLTIRNLEIYCKWQVFFPVNAEVVFPCF